MRDFGYTLETAMADVIDNSVTAKASKVEILAETATDEPWIAIVDNGAGMTEPELIEAMRPGTKNPLQEREGHDLGRFGLGLKSASFSQCRQLTVITRKDGLTSAATWDLDKVAKTNDWRVDLEDNLTDIPGVSRLPETGTIVLWRKLDRLSTNFRHDTTKRSAEINKAISGAERHLRLCFHRYMEGSKPALRILLNERKLSPIDPFATDHPATQPGPEEPLPLLNGEVVTQCFTLPHHKMMSKSEWENLGGG
ncbi:ATP-binding protein [Marinovum sp. 2_MG-2023]|nr:MULTISPECIES: ATP-binding protein [unclassified Marinovum]MDO6732844.1 ATP-binding protein [Marinovum sp. 2_MG-2023]MDO6782114.1 ATP-binding protein [Marinovum sp. 1_MG-2023]